MGPRANGGRIAKNLVLQAQVNRSRSREHSQQENYSMKKVAIAVVAGLTLGAFSSAQAQKTEGWNFEVTPYLWYAG